jgi:type VII secretion protein EssA
MTSELLKTIFDQHVDQISKNERDIAIIQKENEMQTRVFIKFEATVEKLQDLTESMHRLITIHDERITVQAKDIDDIRHEMDKEMRELEARLVSKLTESEDRILNRIDELQQTVKDNTSSNDEKKHGFSDSLGKLGTKLESWKWFIIGVIFAGGVLLGKSGLVSNIFSIFKTP